MMSLITDKLVQAMRTAASCRHNASARRAENIPSLYRCCCVAVQATLCIFVCTARPGRLGRPARIPGTVTDVVTLLKRIYINCFETVAITDQFLWACQTDWNIHHRIEVSTALSQMSHVSLKGL
jgi:hypothetical protein